MTLYLVQATMHGAEYTHYTCQARQAAERLAGVLAEKRPHLAPIRVVAWEPTPEQAARVTRFADGSPGPK